MSCRCAAALLGPNLYNANRASVGSNLYNSNRASVGSNLYNPQNRASVGSNLYNINVPNEVGTKETWPMFSGKSEEKKLGAAGVLQHPWNLLLTSLIFRNSESYKVPIKYHFIARGII